MKEARWWTSEIRSVSKRSHRKSFDTDQQQRAAINPAVGQTAPLRVQHCLVRHPLCATLFEVDVSSTHRAGQLQYSLDGARIAQHSGQRAQHLEQPAHDPVSNVNATGGGNLHGKFEQNRSTPFLTVNRCWTGRADEWSLTVKATVSLVCKTRSLLTSGGL